MVVQYLQEISYMTLGVRWGGGVVFVLVSRSRKVVPEKHVTLMSLDTRDILICLMMVGWKGKDVVKEGVVDLCCLRVSLLGLSSLCR